MTDANTAQPEPPEQSADAAEAADPAPSQAPEASQPNAHDAGAAQTPTTPTPAPDAAPTPPVTPPPPPIDAVLQSAAAIVGDEAKLASTEQLLAERTDDLQRLQAEYVNYKRRVDRDRDLARQQGVTEVVRELIPVLDAIAQAEQHEELNGGFKVIVTELLRTTEKLGLHQFGAIGEEFDPTLHEALMQLPTAEVVPGAIAQVIQPGYQLNDFVLRPARVAVATEVPEQEAPSPAATDE